MILGTLQYPSRYCGLGEGVQKALRFLDVNDPSQLTLGRHVIEPEAISMEVAETTTVPHYSKLFEAHEKYVDIHLTLSGEEWYGYAPINNLTRASDYDAANDQVWYKGEGVYFRIPVGQFALFFPEDAHKPCISFKEPDLIKKLVVKIKLGS